MGFIMSAVPLPVPAHGLPTPGVDTVTTYYGAPGDYIEGMLPIGTAVRFENRDWMPTCGQRGPFNGVVKGYMFFWTFGNDRPIKSDQ